MLSILVKERSEDVSELDGFLDFVPDEVVDFSIAEARWVSDLSSVPEASIWWWPCCRVCFIAA